MKTFQYTIQDEMGIHARPAGMLVKEAKKFSSKITLEAGGKNVPAGNILGVMSLGAKQGDVITVSAEGADEETALAAMKKFLKENL